MSDSYLTLKLESEGLYKEKGSKFIAYACSVKSVEQIQEKIESIHKLHPKSRHVCYAYKLGMDGNVFRINDDGEPSGSAGRPIYNQLESNGLTDVLVAVVRYFGGTKLGVPGLINAYKTSTKEAIAENEIIIKYISIVFKIDFDYNLMGELLNVLKKLGVTITNKTLNEKPSITVEMRRSVVEETMQRFKSKMLNLPIEMITEKTEIPGLTITQLA